MSHFICGYLTRIAENADWCKRVGVKVAVAAFHAEAKCNYVVLSLTLQY